MKKIKLKTAMNNRPPKTEHLQYLRLYEQQTHTLAASLPPFWAEHRHQAYVYLRAKGFPRFGSENYQKVNLTEPFAKDWGLNLGRLPIPAPTQTQPAHANPAPEHNCALSGPNPAMKAVVVNDLYAQTDFRNAKRNLPEGVFAGSLQEFYALYPRLTQKYFGHYAEFDTDGFVALNILFAQDAFVLYIPKGVQAPEPFHLVQLLRSGTPLLCLRRLLIIAEENSHASLQICDHTLSPEDFLVNQVIELHVAAGATFTLNDLEENSHQVTRLNSLFLRQEADSQVVLNVLSLGSGTSRNNIRCRFLGENASLTVGGLGVGGGSQQIDNLVRVEHTQANCRSNQLFKYLLADESMGSFSGRIFVSGGAQKTQAYQNNRNLLLSPSARMYSKPQLEIYADDVQCTHGLATGQLDEDALFYLQQRGIPEDKARVMLSISFADEVIQLLTFPEIRDRVYHLLEARLSGTATAHCSGCSAHLF